MQFFCKVLLIILLTLPAGLRAEDRILESINITEEQGYSVVDIQLNQQLMVTSYSPLNRGDLLRINVKRTGTTLQLTELPTNYQTLPWKPTSKVPLYQITADLADQSLILRFKNPVKYKVRGGTNAFHIFVEIFPALDNHTSITQETEIKEYAIKGASNPKLAKTMQEARTAMLAKDYTRAIQLYTIVVSEGINSTYAKDALEYLGLAHERKGQLAQAKAAYQKYLQTYPEGADTERIMQRLVGILTAQSEPREKLRKVKSTSKSPSETQWETFGSISQFYNRDEQKRNNDPSHLNRSTLQNNLNLSSRLRMQDYQIAGRFTGSYTANFQKNRDDEPRIDTFYMDFSHRSLKAALRVGRQSSSKGGVLGRFDGLAASFQVTEKVRLNLLGGYSVLSPLDIFDNHDGHFYGINADIGTLFNAWDFNAFFIEQVNHGILDRRAVGGEIRYFQPNHSFFTFLDYDIHHNTLNTFIFTGQYTFPDRTTINASYAQRKSPVLKTSNALQGQRFLRGAESVDDLLKFFTEDEIQQLAKDRTATSKTLSLGYSRPLSERFQLNADFIMSNFSATKASGGVSGTEGTGNTFFYSTDLIGSSLFTNGDTYALGFRYNDLDRADMLSFTVKTIYPVTQQLQINPRFRFSHRENVDGTTRWSYRPSVRTVYRLYRFLQFEIEAGYNWETQERTNEQQATTDPGELYRYREYYLIGGYRLVF